MRPVLAILRAVPLVVALGVGVGTAAGAQGGGEASTEHDPLGYVVDLDELDDPASIDAGEELFRTGCVSCHGLGGVGAPSGPPLYDAGAASAHFYLTTGRMPHTGSPEEQATRKPPVYSPEEIEDLVAYVASLGDGPPIPEVDPASASLQEGGDLYRAICAACHSASGAGGALSYGHNAPSLDEATPVQIYEAMLIGPGQMPKFDAYSEEELDSIVAYVGQLQRLEDPGGLSLGRVGPIPEGFVAIVIGTGGTMLAALLIGRRLHDDADPASPSAQEGER
ncbi:MAG: c-type cytochrome [Actinobacteria bacterium]|nr:c-type cytochrome [Actinomycetota bacterium]